MHEYLCIDVERTNEARRAELLNRFTKKGWDLFCVDAGWAYFRRKKDEVVTEDEED